MPKKTKRSIIAWNKTKSGSNAKKLLRKVLPKSIFEKQEGKTNRRNSNPLNVHLNLPWIGLNDRRGQRTGPP